MIFTHIEYDILKRAFYIYAIDTIDEDYSQVIKYTSEGIVWHKRTSNERLDPEKDAFLILPRALLKSMAPTLLEELAKHDMLRVNPEPIGALQATQLHLKDLQKFLFNSNITYKGTPE